MNLPNIVIVDSNEEAADKNSNKDREKYLQQLKDYFPKVKVKPTGIDLQIPLDCGEIFASERKSPLDFLASIGDGRLKAQVENMHSVAKFVAVIIPGKLEWGKEFVKADGENTQWKSVTVRAMEAALQCSGTVVRYCPPDRYAEQVNELYNLFNDPDHSQQPFKRRIITFPELDDRIQFLCQLDGVGVESATQLLEFAGMMDSDADEKGFGTVASSLHHLSIMGDYGKEVRPPLWQGKRGANKILEFRKKMGLANDEYIPPPMKDNNENIQNKY